MNLLCLLFGHNDFPTDYSEWKKTGLNFICNRCNNKWKRVKDIKRWEIKS